MTENLDIITFFVEIPNENTINKITTLEDTNIIKDLIKKLGEKNILINSIKTEINNLHLLLNDYESRELSEIEQTEKEIVHSKILLLDKKQQDLEIIKRLIKLQISLQTAKISYIDYQEARDKELTSLILNRANIYRIKEWLKYIYQKNNLEINSDWYKKFNIYIQDNKRNANAPDNLKAMEARDIIKILENTLSKGDTFLPNDEATKNAITICLLLPELVSQISQTNQRNS